MLCSVFSTHSLEVGSLTEPGVKLAATKPQWPRCLTSKGLGYRHVQAMPAVGFLHGRWGFELRFSCVYIGILVQ